MITLIGLSGEKQSGKDTVYTLIRTFHAMKYFKPFPVRYAFADALKSDIAQAFGTTVDFVNTQKTNPVMRRLLQLYGVACREEDVDVWIKKLDVKLSAKKPDEISIITDVRFKNEAAYVRSKGGRIVKVIGRAKEKQDTHVSETELHTITPDFVIHNTGSMRQLETEVKYLLEQYEIL